MVRLVNGTRPEGRLPLAVATDRLACRRAQMIGRLQIPRDPFEGKGARRTHLRLKVEGFVALALAIAACGLTAALWLKTLAPFAKQFGLG
jgi:hypothetical protein